MVATRCGPADLFGLFIGQEEMDKAFVQQTERLTENNKPESFADIVKQQLEEQILENSQYSTDLQEGKSHRQIELPPSLINVGSKQDNGVHH